MRAGLLDDRGSRGGKKDRGDNHSKHLDNPHSTLRVDRFARLH
jgi:hypothetical protein